MKARWRLTLRWTFGVEATKTLLFNGVRSALRFGDLACTSEKGAPSRSSLVSWPTSRHRSTNSVIEPTRPIPLTARIGTGSGERCEGWVGPPSDRAQLGYCLSRPAALRSVLALAQDGPPWRHEPIARVETKVDRAARRCRPLFGFDTKGANRIILTKVEYGLSPTPMTSFQPGPPTCTTTQRFLRRGSSAT